MQSRDYDDVYALWMKTPGMGMRSLDDSFEGICKFLDRNPTTCFIAKNNEQVIGVIMGGHDGRRGYIYHTAEETSHRHQGIASVLVKSCLEAMREVGIKKVALVAFEDNESGNAFWQAQGFSKREDLVYRNKSLDMYNI